MWYEILPTYIAITTFLAIPNLFVYFSNKLLLGQPYKRRLRTAEDSFQYVRDARLSKRDWAYDFVGLDSIPDLEQPQEPKEPASSC